jgi:peroxiredoxin
MVSPSTSDSSRRLGIGALVWTLAILAGSLSLNVVLGFKVRTLRGMTRFPEPAMRLGPGTAVPTLELNDIGGRKVTLRLSDPTQRTVVLYIFTPSCGWCKRNLANITTLAGLAGSRYRFIGVSLTSDGLANFATSHDLRFSVYSVRSRAVANRLGLGATPQTVAVSRAGKVLVSWVGAYGGSVLSAVEAYFRVPLPGLGTTLPAPLGVASLAPIAGQQPSPDYCYDDQGHIYSVGALIQRGGQRMKCEPSAAPGWVQVQKN